ncbi:MAG: HAMP domain-containing methyl-accepting chemotaxis protein, partial [Alphaproteobacteria bacterium]|nr:HAMP domain-containing methyl-accepting chemotaxis protein [Alphaproteobacteria bacterium]
RHAIGYGGVIHQFKNYMLRGDAPRIAKVRGKLKDLQSAMARYRDLGISPEEEAALTAIGAVFGKYATALGTAQKMVEAGATPKQVDKVVKIDDGPALQALAVLDRRLDAALQASAAGVDRQVAEQRMVALRSAAAVAIFMLAAIAGFLWVGQARVARPLGALGQVMRQLADGENEVEIPHAQRRDEVGAMAQTVEVFRENAIAMARLEGEKAEQERRTAEQQRQARLDMADGLERSIMGVVETINSSAAAMTRSAEAMTGTADQTTRNSTAVSTAAQQASGNVQTAAAAGEELTSSVREISRQVGDSSQISGGAVDEARQAMQQVRGLAEASQRIGEVVDLINDIAGQTNLLALNATIEAARAGEAGKGFAVVASEVKNLATQTAKATDEIGGQINAIQDATGNAVMAIEGISETINRISEIGASIAAAVEEQGAATNEISQNMQEA